jgi:type II secretion system (T2SS) protein M
MRPRDRRALVAGGLAVGITVLALRLGPWTWNALHRSRETLEARLELLARMRSDLGAAAQLQDSGVVVRQRMATLAPRLLAPRDSTQAAMALGALVTLAAERHSVRVSRTDALADSAWAGPARRVSVRASLESDTTGLLGLLQALSQRVELLVVGDVTVVATDPSAAPSRPEVLHTELTVQGWYLPSGSAR